MIETDHKNLTYWKSPWKLTRWTTRWHKKLQDYNFCIVYIQGKNNTPANALSWPNKDEQQWEERQVTLLTPEIFLNLAGTSNKDLIEYLLIQEQHTHLGWLKGLGSTLWVTEDGHTIVPPSDPLKRRILYAYHNGLTGHLGWDKTIQKVLDWYWWPGAWQ